MPEGGYDRAEKDHEQARLARLGPVLELLKACETLRQNIVAFSVEAGGQEFDLPVTVGDSKPPPYDPTRKRDLRRKPKPIVFGKKGYDQRASKAPLAREGGDKVTEAAVEAALDWLQRHQAQDGGWKAADFAPDGRCHNHDPEAHPSDKGFAEFDVGFTALAVLAFACTHKK